MGRIELNKCGQRIRVPYPRTGIRAGGEVQEWGWWGGGGTGLEWWSGGGRLGKCRNGVGVGVEESGGGGTYIPTYNKTSVWLIRRFRGEGGWLWSLRHSSYHLLSSAFYDLVIISHLLFLIFCLLRFHLLSSILNLLPFIVHLGSSIFLLSGFVLLFSLILHHHHNTSQLIHVLSPIFYLLFAIFYLLSAIFSLLSSIFYLLSSIFYLLSPPIFF